MEPKGKDLSELKKIVRECADYWAEKGYFQHHWKFQLGTDVQLRDNFRLVTFSVLVQSMRK